MPTLTEGSPVIAYHKNKWRPGVLRALGRKWAHVQINGALLNSRVPVGAVRAIDTPATRAERPNPFPNDKWEDEYRIKEAG